METRKIIQSGPSSLSITLPNRWLKDNKLEKGNELFLDVQKGFIKILPQASMNKDRLKKEHIITTNKIYLIKEHLNYCFLNNIDNIKIKLVDKNETEDILETIDFLPGLTYSISEGSIIVRNLLNLDEINPEEEYKAISGSMAYFFKETLKNEDKNKQELILSLKSLRKKLLVAQSSVNRILESPFEMNKFDIVFERLIYLKMAFSEMPFLIDSEMELVKTISHINNLKDYEGTLKQLEKVISKQSFTIEERSLFKHIHEKINGLINEAKTINEIKFLGGLNHIASSFLKIISN